MVKKSLWIYLGIYCAAILYLVFSAAINANNDMSVGNMIVSLALLLLPAGVVAIELRGKKVPVIITLAAFLLILVMFLGNLNFNTLAVDTVLKAILLGIMLALLAYLAFKRLFKKKPF